MDISFFGYKVNVEILILIGIVYLILVGHTLCGCSNYSMMEGLEMMTKPNAIQNIQKAIQDGSGNSSIPAPAGGVVAGKIKGAVQSKEGFVGANINNGESSAYDLNSDSIINTSSWSAPNMTVISGQPLNPDVKKFMSREEQPVPLPEGEMFMFETTPFKPECCPNSYSNSSGCACMTGKQYNWLVQRGGNNVPYSEY
jgi:hypothetical protein